MPKTTIAAIDKSTFKSVPIYVKIAAKMAFPKKPDKKIFNLKLLFKYATSPPNIESNPASIATAA